MTRIFADGFPEMNPDADIIVVFGGTNDHGHGDAPMGTETDRTPDTFIGACHFLFSRLPNQFPGAIIVVLTPLHRMGENIHKGERGWLLKIMFGSYGIRRHFMAFLCWICLKPALSGQTIRKLPQS